MPRRRAKTEVGIIFYVLAAIVIVVVAILNYTVENPWILVALLCAVVIAIAVRRVYARKKAEERQHAEKAVEEARMRAEEERITTILKHKGEWGDEMCQWPLNGQYDLTDSRTSAIVDNFAALGQDTCQRLLQKKIVIGDNSDMVKLALGEPTRVDEKLVTEKDQSFRWIYGVPRRGATYIWFKNGRVTKIKT